MSFVESTVRRASDGARRREATPWNQLDVFEKLVPLLETSFTIYALDYPGHGFSDIPKADYRPQLFVNAVEGFLDKLDLTEVTLAGISIGGVIPLIIAANGDPR